MKLLGCSAALLFAVLVAGFAFLAWLLGQDEEQRLPVVDWEEL